MQYMQRDLGKCKTCRVNTATRTVPIEVTFFTEQTAGSAVKPYNETVTISMCGKCIYTYYNDGGVIHASGAQGYNSYLLKEKDHPTLKGMRGYLIKRA